MDVGVQLTSVTAAQFESFEGGVFCSFSHFRYNFQNRDVQYVSIDQIKVCASSGYRRLLICPTWWFGRQTECKCESTEHAYYLKGFFIGC